MKKIKACPICGSRKLKWVGGGLERIGISTLSGKSKCEECGNIIMPVHFDSEKDYKEFLKYLKNRKNTKKD